MSTAVQPNCICPGDSTVQVLAKISNNLANLFTLMSSGKWTGQFVNLGACLCSDDLILKAINNNIVSFFSWLSTNSPALSSQSGVIDLASGVQSKAVVFPSAFAAAPVVFAFVVSPDNTGYVIDATADGGSVTAAGFTAMFGGPMPDNGYKLYWLATPRT